MIQRFFFQFKYLNFIKPLQPDRYVPHFKVLRNMLNLTHIKTNLSVLPFFFSFSLPHNYKYISLQYHHHRMTITSQSLQSCPFYSPRLQFLHHNDNPNAALTWSQMDDALALHALPATHSSNLVDCSNSQYYHTPHTEYNSGQYDWHNHYEDLTADDADFTMDFGDFIF